MFHIQTLFLLFCGIKKRRTKEFLDHFQSISIRIVSLILLLPSSFNQIKTKRETLLQKLSIIYMRTKKIVFYYRIFTFMKLIKKKIYCWILVIMVTTHHTFSEKRRDQNRAKVVNIWCTELVPMIFP